MTQAHVATRNEGACRCLRRTDAAKMAVCIPAVCILAVCILAVCSLAVRTLLGWPIAIAQGPDKVLTVGFSELEAWLPIMTGAGLNNALYKILGPIV